MMETRKRAELYLEWPHLLTRQGTWEQSWALTLKKVSQRTSFPCSNSVGRQQKRPCLRRYWWSTSSTSMQLLKSLPASSTTKLAESATRLTLSHYNFVGQTSRSGSTDCLSQEVPLSLKTLRRRRRPGKRKRMICPLWSKSRQKKSPDRQYPLVTKRKQMKK